MPTSLLLEAEQRQRVMVYMHTGTLPAWISQIPLAAAAGSVCTGVGHGKPARSTRSCIFLATARADPPGTPQQDATGLHLHSLTAPSREGLRHARGGCTPVPPPVGSPNLHTPSAGAGGAGGHSAGNYKPAKELKRDQKWLSSREIELVLVPAAPHPAGRRPPTAGKRGSGRGPAETQNGNCRGTIWWEKYILCFVKFHNLQGWNN